MENDFLFELTRVIVITHNDLESTLLATLDKIGFSLFSHTRIEILNTIASWYGVGLGNAGNLEDS